MNFTFFFLCGKRMSRCPHESWQFLSSGFKYSHARRSCCHSQTYGDLLTRRDHRDLRLTRPHQTSTRAQKHTRFPGFDDPSACSPTHTLPPLMAYEEDGGQSGQLICRPSSELRVGPPPGPGSRLDVVLQAAAQPRVGGVELHTIHSHFSNSPPADFFYFRAVLFLLRWAQSLGDNQSETIRCSLTLTHTHTHAIVSLCLGLSTLI